MTLEATYGRCAKCGGPLLNGHECGNAARDFAKITVGVAQGKPPPGYGPFYAAGLYPKLAELFRECGYALAVHGSLRNDFDLVAVPWIDDAADPDYVIEIIYNNFAMDKNRPPKPEAKPHGRVAYTVHMSFGHCKLDISFTPRLGIAQGTSLWAIRTHTKNGERCPRSKRLLEHCGFGGYLSGRIWCCADSLSKTLT
jgi:hypothetical protein